MLVKSFLAIPKSNNLLKLAKYIDQLENCDVTAPNSKEDVLVVVIENENQKAEDQTLLKLHQAKSLDHIVLVSSFNESTNQGTI